MFKNMERFSQSGRPVGTPKGPDPLTLAIAENAALTKRVAELEAELAKLSEKPKANKKAKKDDDVDEVSETKTELKEGAE